MKKKMNMFGRIEKVAIDGSPRTVCKITNYVIGNDGKIKQKGSSKEVMLKKFVWKYRYRDLKNDNPVNEWMWDEEE